MPRYKDCRHKQTELIPVSFDRQVLRQWILRLKPNSPFRRLIANKLTRKGLCHIRAHWVETTVILECGKAHKRLSVEFEGRNTVAETFCRIGRCRTDL